MPSLPRTSSPSASTLVNFAQVFTGSDDDDLRQVFSGNDEDDLRQVFAGSDDEDL
eukprot:TRINITY_DN362_c0_g1_i1.p2 TRINITY_DN362_c0_g1~~TRINITY_DN362_c0_g1_i1.p2  ORF type:complete len:55 (-),score=12.61 TRINITY_DN362_c0_g1_i1:95-259(-)